MGPPVVIEIVVNPTPERDLARALLESCSGATSRGQCVLDDGDAPRGGATAHVVVTFTPDYLRVSIRSPFAARTAQFREGDPLEERFRAAGLIAAGLAFQASGPRPIERSRPASTPERAEVPSSDAGTDLAEPAPSLPEPVAPPLAPSGGENRSPVPVLSAFGVLGLGGLEPRAGAGLGAAVGLGGSLAFAVLSVAYEQTLRDNAAGLGEQQEQFAAGAGLRVPLSPVLALVLPATVEIEHLRVSVRQPVTGSTDAGSRVRVGCAIGAGLDYVFAGRFGAYVGVRGTVFDERTQVRVRGAVATELPVWESTWTVGLDVQLP